MADEVPPHAAIYVRISDDREGAGLGVERQVEDCRALVSRLGMLVGEVYNDNDVSASSKKPRLGYERLREDVRRGRWAAVVVWHTDRLLRSPLELEGWIIAAESAAVPVPVQTVTAGVLDLASPTGRFAARTHANAARYEVEHKAERQKRQSLQAAQAGKLGGGGHRAYGWDRVRYLDDGGRARVRHEVNDAEATIIREAAERLLAGEPLRSVTMDLSRRKICSSTGKEFSASTVKRMLLSARMSGQREHQPRSRSETKRQIVGPILGPGDGSWEAILTTAQTDELRDKLLDPSRRLTNLQPRKCLLSGGLLRCHQCGSNMCGRPREDHRMRYICPRVPGAPHKCGRTFILAAETDAYVTGMVLAALDTPELLLVRDEASAELTRRLEGELLADQRLLQDFGTMLGLRDMTTAEFGAARRPVTERIEATRVALRATRRAHPKLLPERDYRAAWPDLPLNERRAVLRAVLDFAVVGPGRRGYNRFDTSRISLTWLV